LTVAQSLRDFGKAFAVTGAAGREE